MKYSTRYIAKEQERALLEAVTGNRLEAAVRLALHCGVKCGELMRIRERDIDQRGHAVNVEGRTVTITQEETEKLLRAVHALHDGFSFDIYTAIYAGYCQRYLQQLVRELCARQGLEGVGLPELRHTAVVRWIQAGTDMHEIQNRAGYADFTTAYHVYAEVLEAKRRAELIFAQ